MNGSPYQSVFDVVVVGRAAIGLAAALALARAGLRVAMVGPDPLGARDAAGGAPSSFSPGAVDADVGHAPAGARAAAPASAPQGRPPSEGHDWDDRVFALSPSSRQLLESLDVWHALDAARIAPVHDMRIWPQAAGTHGEAGAGGARVLHFSAWQAGIEALAWILENRNLTNALSQACRFAGFPVHSAPLVDLDTQAEPGAACLSLADGRELRARLVVAADGADSRVRQLAGIAGKFVDYPQRAIVANFDTTLPHRDCAYQWFGGHGVLALLPLPAPTDRPGFAGRCSIVWSAPVRLAEELLSIDPSELAARVGRVTGSALGAMAPLGRSASFPLRLGRVESLIAHRVALVGDAAHVIHPLAGQGMNLGFGDVHALARTLRTREPLRDPGERMLLRRYERARAEPVLAMRLATDGLQKLFDESSPLLQGPLGAPLSALRAAGWSAVAHSDWLRRFLISQAVS